MLTNLAAFISGVLRLRWYSPLLITIAIFPLDILIAYYLAPDGHYLLRAHYLLPAIPWVLVSAHIVYGAGYSLSLAWIGALPIHRKNVEPKLPAPPEQREKRRVMLRALAVMALAAIGAGLFMWQSTLYVRGGSRAFLTALATFAAAGSLLGYHLWFLRRH